jgi:MFS family permease
MASVHTADASIPTPKRLPIFYGWVVLSVAALAMVATLPGRTQGLGLITEPLLRDLQINRTTYATINLVATLAGSVACIGFGRLIDRFGVRWVMTLVAAALGLVVLAMGHATGVAALGIGITLSRALGQSALSVASLSVVPLWFHRRQPMAMATYSVVLSVGFMIAFPWVGSVVSHDGWRPAWNGVGWALLLGMAPIAALMMRNRPSACGLQIDGDSISGPASVESTDDATTGDTWRTAIRRSHFWVFALGSTLYGFVAAGMGLFNESILAELGFASGVYHNSLVVTALTGLIGNFLGGWLLLRRSPTRLMALAMTLLACGLWALPHLRTVPAVLTQAAVTGLAGGLVTVLFFSIWSRYFGRLHLATIQGAAQTLTVIGSALGPLWLAKVVEWTGSYAIGFRLVGCLIAAVAVWALKVGEPRLRESNRA